VRWHHIANASGFSSGAGRDREAKSSALRFTKGAKNCLIQVLDFPNSFFPSETANIKKYFEHLKAIVAPDLIFTHARHDLHQDHRVINQLTWNTWRNHLILEYEIPKYDGDLRSPNFFVTFPSRIAERKIRNLMACFGSQRSKQWFTDDTFRGLMRIRGVEAASNGRFAEGFYARKVVLGTP